MVVRPHRLRPLRRLLGLLSLLGALLVTSWASAAKPPHAGVDGPVYPSGRQRVKAVLDANRGWTPPPNTVVYVLGGNFDYSKFTKGYMSPARTAAKQLGLPVVDSSANPNGSLKDNAARIRQDIAGILAKKPGATILVAANSKGYADWHEAMVDAPPNIRTAKDRIGVFALTPNWGGSPKANQVLQHPWLERTAKKLLARPNSPWSSRSLADITPEARARTIAGYANKPRVETKTIVATAHVGRRSRGTDGIVPLHAQIPRGVAHERWEFSGATHGSFTTAGWKSSRSTRLHKAALIQLSQQLSKRPSP